MYLDRVFFMCKTCANVTLGCVACANQSSCTQCDEKKGFWPTPQPDNTCACTKERFFDNKNSNCTLCSDAMMGCSECDNN